MQTMIEHFKHAITEAGLQPPQTLIADGKIHRFCTNGKKSDTAGWYVIYLDGLPAGAFGDWRTGESHNWCSRDLASLSPTERASHRARVQEIATQRDFERKLRESEARDRALKTWQESDPASEDHPYLKMKGISPHGIRMSRGNLVIPMSDATGLQNLQFIMPDGCKRFLTGGRVKGCYFSIGQNTGSILIAEGFATGASLYGVALRIVVVAFSAENLPATAKAVRSQFPSSEIIVCADDDFSKSPNVGLAKASEAASAVGGKLAIPEFTVNRLPSDTDFNDLRRLEGHESVQISISKAVEVSQAVAIDDWADPVPIVNELRPVARFDPDLLLPTPLREFVMDVADRMPCPPEYVAVALLVALGSVIGARCAIKPKQRDDWQVVPNLWGAVVGEPATKKSPALEAALKPLEALSNRALKEYTEKKSQYEQASLAHNTRKKEFERRLRDESGKLPKGEFEKQFNEMIRQSAELPPEPKMRRFKTNDATVEKLIEILRDNPNGILNYRDELAGMFDTFEKAGREGDRTFFLEGSNGNGSYDCDRIMRGSVHAANICLSVLGGIQPQRLRAHLSRASKSLTNDGLLQRFQLLVAPDTVSWDYRDRDPDRAAKEKIEKLFEQLSDLDPLRVGARLPEGNEKFPSFRFSPEAQVEYAVWSRRLNEVIIPNEEDSLVQQHLGKYEKLVPALALIFHLIECIDNGVNEFVSIHSIKKSILWSELLESHARRVYGLLREDGSRSARSLSLIIEKGRFVDGFTARDIKRANLRELTSDEEVYRALEWLESDGWIRGEVQGGSGPGGGRRTTRYRINPKLQIRKR